MLLLRTFLFSWLTLIHPYYVSVTEIEYSTQDKELGISVKFFSDDIEAALKQMSGGKVDIIQGDKNTNTKLLAAYLSKHLIIKADGKTLGPQWLGYENDQGATWCYIRVKDLNQPHELQVYNDLLYEYRKDQLNFIHAIVNGDRKTVQLAMPEHSTVFQFP